MGFRFILGLKAAEDAANNDAHTRQEANNRTQETRDERAKSHNASNSLEQADDTCTTEFLDQQKKRHFRTKFRSHIH